MMVPFVVSGPYLGLELGEGNPWDGLIRMPVCAVNGSKKAFRQAVSHTPPYEFT